MNRTFAKATLFWLIACSAWTLLILVFSLVPHPPELALPFLSWDKFQHASAYALLTLFIGRSWTCFRPWNARIWWWAAASALVFGIAIELLQGLMGIGRSADPRDVLANAIGILSACLLVYIRRRLWPLRD